METAVSETLSENRRRGRPAAVVIGLLLACVVLAALDVALVLQNRELTARLESVALELQFEGQPAEQSFEGVELPAGKLMDRAGNVVELSTTTDSFGTILFVSSPSCDYCEDAQPMWERVMELTADAPLRIFGVVLEADPLQLDPDSCSYDLLTPEDRGLALFKELPGVPATFFIAPDGMVQSAVFGADSFHLEQATEEFLVNGIRNFGVGDH